MLPKLQQSLESLAWASVGLSLVASLGYSVFGVVLTLAVEHIGWFNALAPLSAWMLATVHLAANVFAACCILVTLGATGMRMRIAVPLVMTIPFAYLQLSIGFTQLLALITPFAALAFASVVANLWSLIGSLTTFILLCFAVSTAPRNGYGYLLFAIVTYTVVLVGLCTYAVFNSSGFDSWSPWIRLLLSCGIATTCFTIGLGALKFLTVRWPPSPDSRKTLETWMVALGGAGFFIAGYAVWHFATDLLGYDSWFAKALAGFALGGGLAFAALLVVGTIISIIGDGVGDDNGDDDSAAAGADAET
jgi:hypothetical protein